MNLNKISLIAAVAALMLTGCNNDLVLQNDASDNAIEFRTVMDKTRASLIDGTDELTSIFVHAGYGDNPDFMNVAAYLDSDWTYAPKKYWPADGSSVDFYAYAPIKDINMGSFNFDGSNPASFVYTVPYEQNISNTAVDLLVASKLQRTKDGGIVNFTFKHALSSVTFSAINDNDEDSDLLYTISNIEITNLCNQGKYTYDIMDSDDPYYDSNEHWSNYSNVSDNGKYNYIAGISPSGVAVRPDDGWVRLLSLNDYMMVLPQEVPYSGNETPDMDNHTFVKVTFSLKQPDGKYYVYDKDVYFWLNGFTFAEGVRYDFKFSFQQNGGFDDEGNPIGTDPTPIVLNVIEVENWGDANGIKESDIHQYESLTEQPSTGS